MAMGRLQVFHTETQSSTLVVVPLGNISSLSGDVVQSDLECILAEFDQRRATSAVVDFCHVSYFGSVMLAAVQMIWKRVRSLEGKLGLCNVSQVGREILHVSKFDSIWPIYDSRQEALEATKTQAV